MLQYPFFLQLYINNLLVVLFLFFILLLLELNLYLRSKDKSKFKSTVFDIRAGLKSSKRRPAVIIILLYFILSVGYPLLLLSTGLYTSRIITTGKVIQKYGDSITEFRRYGGVTTTVIDEIEIEDYTGKVTIFNMAKYPEIWKQIKINDTISIRHYPYLLDTDLEIMW